MKKFYMILAAIAAFTVMAQAQNFATVNVGSMDDATIYNDSYFNMAPTNFYLAHTGVQMLYTPDLLADMNGKQNVRIKSLDFWFSCETFEDITRDVKIYLQEVDATEFAVNEEGVKQFFEFGEPVKEMTIHYDMLNYYGEDVNFNFDFEPFAFTPGKSLLVTMVFDAQDDDNCTMGSDYAPFHTSGIRSHAMTYTDNWTSFVDFAMGNDFPNATVLMGCGTNVELPVTAIGYNYDEGTIPVDPVIVGAPVFQGYTIDGITGYGVGINPTTEGSEIMYRVLVWDPVAEDWVLRTDWTLYEGTEGEIWFENNGEKVRIEAYAFIGENRSQDVAYEFTVATALNELMGGKTVASTRYFNVAGQEMKQAEGLTIVVTTYTDGTTSAAKVVK